MSASKESKIAKVATQCAKCHRAVWTTDADADGVCVLCAPADDKPTKPFVTDLGIMARPKSKPKKS